MEKMQHDKYDYSDITCSSSSSAPSSSAASPKRSVFYYVDSPSSRSESNNDAASPLYSPTPPHHDDQPPPPPRATSPSSYRPSSSRLSSSTSTTPSPPPLLGRSRKPPNSSRSAYYCYAIREDKDAEEHDEDDGDDEYNTLGRYYYNQINMPPPVRHCHSFCMAILGFGAVFGFFCLILWGAAQPFKPAITVKRLTTHNLDLGVGTDHTGVPTRLLTLNCSVDMAVHNPATFFGIHLLSDSVHLMYSRITVATGQIRKYYQPRKSHRTLKVKVEGHQVPLYGVGESFAKWDRQGKVPVRLLFHVLSNSNVIGKLLTVKHRRHISCSLFIANSHHNNKSIKLDYHNCIYT